MAPPPDFTVHVGGPVGVVLGVHLDLGLQIDVEEGVAAVGLLEGTHGGVGGARGESLDNRGKGRDYNSLVTIDSISA